VNQIAINLRFGNITISKLSGEIEFKTSLQSHGQSGDMDRLVEKDTLTQLINPAKLEALLEAACLNLTSDLPRPKRLISCKNYFYFLIFNV